MDKWHIGDPVDWGDGWMDAQNWHHRQNTGYYGSTNNIKTAKQCPKRDEYSKKAWDYYLDNKFTDALHYINLALDLDSNHPNNWNRKAIILEYMGNYRKSEKCYNKSLKLNQHSLVADNKARMLYNWADHLLTESRKMPNGLDKLKQALEKNKKAINALPEDTEENIDNFISQRHMIRSAIRYEDEYRNNVKILKTYDKKELFTITGRKFCKTDINLTYGMSLKLVKEPDNEFDKDAIAVYAQDKKIGYVANNEDTKFELTSSASELQKKIKNIAQGEYLIYLRKPTNIYIGRIITQK